MLFVSLTFVFLFLPCVLILYYILRKRRVAQNIILLLGSLFFYAWGEPVYVVVLILSILINWLLARFISSNKENARRAILYSGIIINIGILFFFKYFGFVLSQIGALGIINMPVVKITNPIGISFYTFQVLSYIIDVYRGEKCQNNPLYVGLYVSFFPQLIAGPIVRYNTIINQIENRVESFELFKTGVNRFVIGFSKKVLLANTMAGIADKAFSVTPSELTTSFAILGGGGIYIADILRFFCVFRYGNRSRKNVWV